MLQSSTTMITILFFMIILIKASSSFSLLDRVHGKDVRTIIPDFRTSDADVGMRSAHFIGSFRGKPIKTRQGHAFIDDNGVPIPLLPYSDFSGENNHHSSRLFKKTSAKKLQKLIDSLRDRS